MDFRRVLMWGSASFLILYSGAVIESGGHFGPRGIMTFYKQNGSRLNLEKKVLTFAKKQNGNPDDLSFNEYIDLLTRAGVTQVSDNGLRINYLSNSQLERALYSYETQKSAE